MPTLYLLPGLLCDASTFARQVAALRDDYDVRTLDFLRFDSLEAMAAHVLDKAPARFSVCGFSMGGRVALQIMRDAPERVERLCLLDTGVGGVAPGEAEKRQVLVDLARAQGMKALCDAWLPPMLHPARRADRAFVAPLEAMVMRATPDIFEGQIRALLGRRDQTDLLPLLRLPVLVAAGRQDEWSTLAQHEAFAKRIPGARLVAFDDCGHFSPIEAADALSEALRVLMREPASAGA